MKISISISTLSLLLPLLLLSLLCLSPSSSADQTDDFVKCLSNVFVNISTDQVAYTPRNASYLSILSFSIQNLRFASAANAKPQAIVTVRDLTDMQVALQCARNNGLEIRVRSGGHDFEGQSYTGTQAPFIIIDLVRYKEITVDVQNATVWVQAGATIGELHYAIASKTKTLAFPGAEYPTIGVGGFISGGGYGPLMRKYGLAADNVLDGVFMDANGNVYIGITRMVDVFWAIRGGGASNFGIVLAWKLKLVPVPEKVAVFTTRRSLQKNPTSGLLDKWQRVFPQFSRDLYLKVNVTRQAAPTPTLQSSFHALFLGGADKLFSLMRRNFPELGVARADCLEMSWAESLVYFYSGSRTGQPLEVLLNRDNRQKDYFKIKSDYATEPISVAGLQGLLQVLLEEEGPGAGEIVWIPHGGRMSEIPESRIPYPHRAGILYLLLQGAHWHEGGDQTANKHLNWIRRLSSYLTPYVSKNPRAAYVNHRDLDLGVTGNDTTVGEARAWGVRYFKGNFDRLVRVKTSMDRDNIFRNQQSIPPMRS